MEWLFSEFPRRLFSEATHGVEGSVFCVLHRVILQ
jgi:hypothetical protein